MNPVDNLLTLKMPAASMFFMGLSAAAAVFFPVILFLVFNRKCKMRAFPMLAGMVTFAAFALVLEPVFLRLMPLDSLRGIYPMPAKNIAAYTAIVCLAAGVFEETGRFVTIKWILKKNNGGLDTPLSYGIGHGGIESALLVGLSLINLLLSAVMLNAGMLGAAFAQMTEEAANAQAVAFIDMVNSPPVTFLAGGVERLAAVTFHVCASVLVWTAVTKPGRIWLYPAAILLHAVFNIPAALYQTGVISNVWLTEAMVVASALLVAAALYLRLRRSKPSE